MEKPESSTGPSSWPLRADWWLSCASHRPPAACEVRQCFFGRIPRISFPKSTNNDLGGFFDPIVIVALTISVKLRILYIGRLGKVCAPAFVNRQPGHLETQKSIGRTGDSEIRRSVPETSGPYPFMSRSSSDCGPQNMSFRTVRHQTDSGRVRAFEATRRDPIRTRQGRKCTCSIAGLT